MKLKWKIFRTTFPYICNNCGEFSSLQREYCEVCGKKDSLRKIEIGDYEKAIENSKLIETNNKSKKRFQKDKDSIFWKKKKEGRYMILIVICAILIIDLVGFFILLNVLDIPLEEIGENLWLFSILLGFSILVLIISLIAIYFAYFYRKHLWWLHLR